MARAQRRFTARAQRRPGTWSRFVDTGIVAVPAASKVLVASAVLSNPGINETLRRVRGFILLLSDQTAATERQLGAFGICVASDAAVAAGAASLPGPVTELDDDLWQTWLPLQGALTVVSGVGFILQDNKIQIDSKAMRRIQQGQSLAIMAENASATFGFSVYLAVSLYATMAT